MKWRSTARRSAPSTFSSPPAPGRCCRQFPDASSPSPRTKRSISNACRGARWWWAAATSRSSSLRRSEEHTSELQSHSDLVCRLLLEKKKNNKNHETSYFRHSKHNKCNLNRHVT